MSEFDTFTRTRLRFIPSTCSFCIFRMNSSRLVVMVTAHRSANLNLNVLKSFKTHCRTLKKKRPWRTRTLITGILISPMYMSCISNEPRKFTRFFIKMFYNFVKLNSHTRSRQSFFIVYSCRHQKTIIHGRLFVSILIIVITYCLFVYILIGTYIMAYGRV